MGTTLDIRLNTAHVKLAVLALVPLGAVSALFCPAIGCDGLDKAISFPMSSPVAERELTCHDVPRSAIWMLQDPEVATELILSHEQLDNIDVIRTQYLNAVRTELDHDTPLSERKAIMERHALHALIAILAVLDEAQRLRLQQLALRKVGVRALAMPSVANALELSEDQRKRVETAFQRQDPRTTRAATVEDILNDEQLTIWREMIGAPPQIPKGDPDRVDTDSNDTEAASPCESSHAGEPDA
jgi:hypothetical protein